MTRNSTQQWQPGQQVRVGFLTLTVRATIATPGDGMPDAYLLSNAAGTQLYRFVPHHGVEKVDADEARAIVAAARRCADHARAVTAAKAQADARSAAAIAQLLAA